MPRSDPSGCNHANENPYNCPCDFDCYCKDHTCVSPFRRATHPVTIAQPSWMVVTDPAERDAIPPHLRVEGMFVLIQSAGEIWMLSEGTTNAHWVMRRRQTSAMFCEHANEMPSYCPCTLDCYCKANACRSPDRWAIYPIPHDTFVHRHSPPRAAAPPPLNEPPKPEAPRLENAFAMLLRDDIVSR